MPPQNFGKHCSIEYFEVQSKGKSCSFQELAILLRNKPEVLCMNLMLLV